MPGPAPIRVEGLRELQRDLKAAGVGLPKELAGAMQEAAKPVAQKASSIAKRRSGRYAASIKARRQQRRVAIGSSLPYANVQHWGGTTGRGHRPGVAGSGSVKVVGDRAIEKAAESEGEAFLERIGDRVERFLAHHGFK